jgi:hypothetical protein
MDEPPEPREEDDDLAAALLDAGLAAATFPLVAACRDLHRDRPAFLAALKRDHGVASLAARQRVANALGAARRRGRVRGVRPVRQAGSLPDGAIFLTYGDGRYAEQRERILKQAAQSGWFGERPTCMRFERQDAEQLVMSSQSAQAVLNLERGGGYWIWKPLVIREALSSVSDGVVVLYADAGCTLHASDGAGWEAKLRGLSDTVPIDCPRLHGRTIDGKTVNNGAWCRADVAQAVLQCGAGSAALERFYAADQLEANRVLLLACDRSRELVDEWARLALTAPHLFTDAPSAVANRAGFYEHRHDQAIFSALMHRRGWSGSLESTWTCAVATRLRTEALEFWKAQGQERES